MKYRVSIPMEGGSQTLLLSGEDFATWSDLVVGAMVTVRTWQRFEIGITDLTYRKPGPPLSGHIVEVVE